MNHFYSLFFLLLPITCLAQQKDFTIKNIYFDGAKKTDTHFLLERLIASEDQIYNNSQAKIDIQNLKNFPGIGNAQLEIDTIGERIELRFIIDEQQTLLPIINFGGVEGNAWYQLGFADNNFLGKGNFFSVQYQNSDSRHSGQAYLRANNIRNTKWGFSLSLARWASVEPLFFPDATVDYEYDYNSVAVSGIYNFTNQKQLEVGLNYFVEDYEKITRGNIDLPGPTNLTQPKLLGNIRYVENLIDYHFFYQSGLAWSANFQDVYNIPDETFFHIFLLDARYFVRPTSSSNLGLRLHFGLATNNNSPFAPFVVDSRVNLRGSGNRIDRGTAQLVLNLEHRKTIYHTDNWAGQVVVFSDFGTWRNPGGRISDLIDTDSFRHFVGGGVRLIYKKLFGAVLRIDYGIDIYNTSESGIVLGFGQYF
jgi:outer membrane protein assembly factor BamA